MQTILVTGASGFIGKNFLKKFNKNFLIFALLKERVKEKKKKLIKGKNIKYIFFKNKNQIKKLIKDIEINYFVNLATYYTKENEEKDINKLIDSNIQFPTIILNSINKNRLKKILTIGTMAEHSKNHYYRPVNLYAASKKAFEKLLYFYKVKYPKIYFYNLKFYETYHKDDHRPKFVPLLINSYKNNKKIILNSSNLKLNFLHVDDVNNAIKILLTKNIKNGDYLVKSNKFTNLKELIDKLNIFNPIKIKYEVLNKFTDNINFKIKKLPFWKQKINFEKDLKKIFYEINKNKI